jgi:hypothetical protein
LAITLGGIGFLYNMKYVRFKISCLSSKSINVIPAEKAKKGIECP